MKFYSVTAPLPPSGGNAPKFHYHFRVRKKSFFRILFVQPKFFLAVWLWDSKNLKKCNLIFFWIFHFFSDRLPLHFLIRCIFAMLLGSRIVRIINISLLYIPVRNFQKYFDFNFLSKFLNLF